MPRDPLHAVLRLRRLAMDDAMRELAAALATEGVAAEVCARIEAAIVAEQQAVSRLDADDLAVEAFGRWLRRIRRERDAASAAREQAGAETVRVRAVLGAARASLAVIESEIQRRTEEARAAALLREQAVIDESAQQRRG